MKLFKFDFWNFVSLYLTIFAFIASFQIKRDYLPFDLALVFFAFALLMAKRTVDYTCVSKLIDFLFEKKNLINKEVFEKKKKERDLCAIVIEDFEYHAKGIYKKDYRYALICGSSLLFFNLFLFHHFVLSFVFLLFILIENKFYYKVKDGVFIISESLEEINNNEPNKN